MNVCGNRLIAVFASLVFLSTSMYPSASFAAGENPQTFTYQGRLMNAAATAPLGDATADIRVDILSPQPNPNECILFAEDHLGVALNNGVFSIKVGGGIRTAGVDPGKTMRDVFTNVGALANRAAAPPVPLAGLGVVPDPQICPVAYTAAVNDFRMLRVVVNAASLGGKVLLTPDQSLTAVPWAINSERAESLQGFAASGFVQVTNAGAGASDISQANVLNLVNGTDISGLATPLHNHDARYFRAGTDADLTTGDVYAVRAGIGGGLVDASMPAGVDLYIRQASPALRLGSNDAGGTNTMKIEFYDATGAGAMRGRIETGQSAAGGINIYTDGTATSQLAINGGGASFNKTVQVGKYIAGGGVTGETTLETSLNGAPAASAGYVWMNTSTNKLRYWDGTIATGKNVASETWVNAGYLDLSGNNTMTGALKANAGTAALPGYTFSNAGNQDTGISSSTADQLAFSTAGVERVRIDSTGGVAVGAFAPTAMMHLPAGTANALTAPLKFTMGTNLTALENGAMEFDGADLYFTASGTRSKVLVSGGGAGDFIKIDGTNTMSVATQFKSAIGSATTPGITFTGDTNTGLSAAISDTLVLSTSGAERLRIDPNGRIGVGAFAPTASVHLPTGVATANGAPLKFTMGTNLTALENGAVEFDGTDYFVTANNSRKKIITGSNGVNDFLMTGGTNAMTAAINAFDGNAATPGYTFAADTNTGFYRSAVDEMRFVTNGADRVTFDATGKVG
ncbi:MAG: hypothetical protein SGI74_13160, partial [Oligoflexia bacterium]|nr:hypothetical protein [Oligoflexia bacterium]